MAKKLFTSESVTEGHPDKLADQISDAVLDAILAQDPVARVACETAVTTGMAFVMGEISTTCYVDIPKVVRETVIATGYDRAKYGFDGQTCAVITAIDEQSSDIALGVNCALEKKQSLDQAKDEVLGAGDQGMMFGFATNETEEYMPMTLSLSHKICRRLAQVRKDKSLPFLNPDGKAQVTIEYEDGKPCRIDTVLVSAQHSDKTELEALRESILNHVILPVLPEELVDKKTRFFVNPTGRFVIGGPMGDSGLTGRKIIVDTYGGMARHGGGCFSGKDPTKVDRSAAYAARYAAKNLVAAGLADKCELQLAYAIGVAHPVSIAVETYGTSSYSDEALEKALMEVFDFTPSGIIKGLNLRRPIYRQTAAYGHFGRLDLDLPWEKLDKVEELRRYFKI